MCDHTEDGGQNRRGGGGLRIRGGCTEGVGREADERQELKLWSWTSLFPLCFSFLLYKMGKRIPNRKSY